MRAGASTATLWALLLGLAAAVSACATGQQDLAHDDGDRLYLKYIEIARHPAPATPEETADIEKIRARIAASKDSCTSWKDVILTKTYMELIGLWNQGLYSGEVPQARDNALAELKRFQSQPISPTTECVGQPFPKVAIQ